MSRQFPGGEAPTGKAPSLVLTAAEQELDDYLASGAWHHPPPPPIPKQTVQQLMTSLPAARAKPAMEVPALRSVAPIIDAPVPPTITGPFDKLEEIIISLQRDQLLTVLRRDLAANVKDYTAGIPMVYRQGSGWVLYCRGRPGYVLEGIITAGNLERCLDRLLRDNLTISIRGSLSLLQMPIVDNTMPSSSSKEPDWKRPKLGDDNEPGPS